MHCRKFIAGIAIGILFGYGCAWTEAYIAAVAAPAEGFTDMDVCSGGEDAATMAH